MKYPKEQYELLIKGLKILDSHFDITSIHPCQLQYTLYQQASKGQEHNAYFINENGNVARGYYLAAFATEGYVKLIDFLNEDNFPLYPEGCNDSHVENAVKKALKEFYTIG